jgi:hypothetical protein
MIAKEPTKKNDTVVVRYKIPQKRQVDLFSYSSFFLSNTQIFKFKTELLLNFDYLDVSHIIPVSNSSRPKANLIVFVFHSNFHALIHEVEDLLGKHGRIEPLLAKAKIAENRKAVEDDISVELENGESADVFSEVELEEEQVSGMRFYEYNEKAHSLLNKVIAGYSRLALSERKKETPDAQFLKEIDENKSLATNLLRKSKTFSSLDQMNEVITQYTPIARVLYDYNPSGSPIVSL